MANRKRPIVLRCPVTAEERALLCGLPFGIHRMCVWIVPGGDSLGGGAALFVLNFVIGGIIGGFVLVWRLLVAAWYVPLTIYRLIVGY